MSIVAFLADIARMMVDVSLCPVRLVRTRISTKRLAQTKFSSCLAYNFAVRIIVGYCFRSVLFCLHSSNFVPLHFDFILATLISSSLGQRPGMYRSSIYPWNWASLAYYFVTFRIGLIFCSPDFVSLYLSHKSSISNTSLQIARVGTLCRLIMVGLLTATW